MKSEDLLRALSDVDPKLLAECDRQRSSVHSSRRRSAVLLLVAAAILLSGVSTVFFSVRNRQSNTGASAESAVETSVLEPDAPESAETEAESAEKDDSEEPAEVIDYEGIKDIRVILEKEEGGTAVCSCILTTAPGYSVSAVVSLTHSDYHINVNRGGNINCMQRYEVPSSGSYQTGALITVFDAEGKRINCFSKFSESVYIEK